MNKDSGVNDIPPTGTKPAEGHPTAPSTAVVEPAGSDVPPDVGTPVGRRKPFGVDRYGGLYVLALVIVIFSAWVPDTFLTVQTLTGIAQQQSITAILALAVLLPMAAGVFDLSCAAMLGLGVVIVCQLQSIGVHWVLAVVLTMLAGTVVGAINAFIVIGLRVTSFIATLGMSSVLGGLVYWVSGNQQITEGISPTFITLGQGTVLGIPLPVVYLAVLAVIIGYVTEFRPLGRKLYAAGGNVTAARLSGVHTDRLAIVTLLISGTLASLAGVIFAATIGSASLTVGPPFLLPTFAALFLGATQIHPGRANVLGTLIAVALLGAGVKGLLLVGAQFWISDLFNGLALVTAVALAVKRGRNPIKLGPS